MNSLRIARVVPVVLILGGVACTPPQMLVYSAGFSFSKYDFLVFGKPLPGQSTALYGMDVEVANLMARYNMKIIGDKEFASMRSEDKDRTLFVRFAISSYSPRYNLITLSFDDAQTDKTVASLTSQAKGNLFKPKDRTKALEAVSKPLIQALTNEKGLKVTNENK